LKENKFPITAQRAVGFEVIFFMGLPIMQFKRN
jgi:hypothetical protein